MLLLEAARVAALGEQEFGNFRQIRGKNGEGEQDKDRNEHVTKNRLGPDVSVANRGHGHNREVYTLAVCQRACIGVIVTGHRIPAVLQKMDGPRPRQPDGHENGDQLTLPNCCAWLQDIQVLQHVRKRHKAQSSHKTKPKPWTPKIDCDKRGRHSEVVDQRVEFQPKPEFVLRSNKAYPEVNHEEEVKGEIDLKERIEIWVSIDFENLKRV